MDRRSLLFQHRRDPGVAGDPLQAEQAAGAEHVGATLGRSAPSMFLELVLDPIALGAVRISSGLGQMLVHGQTSACCRYPLWH